MKPYVAVSGAIFAIVLALHVWRLGVEGPSILSSPYFAVSSAVSLAMALWGALVLLRKGVK